MNSWSWLITTLIIQLGAQMLKPRTYCRGKYLTMPLRRKFPKQFNHPFCRMVQIVSLLFIFVALEFVDVRFFYLYCIGIMALSVDDYFSDEEDKKRFKEWARNKIKWKMELPKPVKVRGTA